MLNYKNIDLLVNLGSYRPKYLIFRITLISLAAILLIYFVGKFTGQQILNEDRVVYAYLLSVLAFNAISEFNLLLISLFKKSRYLRTNFYLQVFLVVAPSFLIIYFCLKLAGKILVDENILYNPATQIIVLVGVFILIIHSLIIVISNLSKEWMNNRKEIEDLKQAKLLSDYNSLKDRLNPHFLFNNLSVLKSLIKYDSNSAEIFTQNFTDVYRYVLKSHQGKTVTLEEELEFVNSYIALHKERLGSGIEFNINVDSSILKLHVPPMAVQLLIENAIKHNVTSKHSPLIIELYTRKNSLVVKNSINKKDTTYSTKTGLQTLNSQYKLISTQQVVVEKNNNTFAVSIPLLEEDCSFCE